MAYIYSQRNKPGQFSLSKIWGAISRYPKQFWQKLKNDKIFRSKLTRFVVYFAAAFFLFLSVTFAVITLTLPNPSKLGNRIVAQSTKIYARDGSTLLYEIHGEAKRTLIELDNIPDYAKQATIAIEDKNFYHNSGIDWNGIFRAVGNAFTSASLSGPGGSTITQQFVKNAILTNEKTITRKIKEIVLAIEINQRFSKDEILKLYLNEIPYGQNAYGIEAAAQTYFGKHAHDITLAEAAYLAALPQAPSHYNPNGPYRDDLDTRKDIILDQMVEQGYISREQADEAKAQKVVFSKIKDAILAPHFVLYVQAQLAEKYGEQTLEEGGLKVITSLDWNMQQAAEQAVKDGVAINEKKNNATNAGLVAMNPKTGEVLAMVGSRDYFDNEHDGQVNVALQELQPGSSIKPYIYATAFKQGMSPATMLMDVRTVFGSVNGANYAPANYNGADNGIVNMRKAMAGSLNVPAVKTLALVGVQNAINTAKDMGITSDISAERCGLSLVLGGCEIRLIDHVSAMGVFANMGIRHEETSILKVEDGQGKVLEEFKPDAGTEVLDPQVAYQIDSIMTDNDARTFVFGSRSPLILSDRVVAAKTGTTNEWRDGWTMGFTPSLVAGVWTGNNDHSKMRAGADGVITAAPIWNQFMRNALKGTPAETFQEPRGIQHVVVDAVSGKLPTQYTINTRTDVFASFALPKDFDNVHVGIEINKFNGKLAGPNTPEEARETRTYTILHSEMPNNSNWENPVIAWAVAHGYNNAPTEIDDGTGPITSSLNFITPEDKQSIKELPLTVQLNGEGITASSVDLFLDNQKVGTSTSAPYSYQLNQISNGAHTLSATAHLTDGTTIQNSIKINVQIQK
jgi:1A family penicillin-binding protein